MLKSLTTQHSGSRRLLILAVGVAVSLTAMGHAEAAPYDVLGPPGGEYPLGSAAFHVTTGDFDGDGTPDLAAPNSLDETVSIFMGDGRGGFRTKKVQPAGDSPLVAAVADFNEDGIQDLATSEAGGTTILLGHGNGRFTPSTIDLGAMSGTSIVAADLNRDGHVDLALSSRYWIKVVVLLGHGDGTFSREPDLPFPSNNGVPIGINAGDFDGDGYPDLAVADRYFADVVVYLNDGDGTFGAGRRWETNSYEGPNNIVVGDFNEDGHLDMAAPGRAFRDQVALLFGNGDGTFELQYAQLTLQSNQRALGVAVGDVNGDCHLDITTSPAGIGVLLGGGDGTFEHVQQFRAGRGSHFLGVADFDGNGADDVAIPNTTDRTLSVALAREPGTCG